RFSADLGTGKTPHWSDDLAAFPSDDTVLTGGQTLTVRNLENGNQVSSLPTGGLSDHAVWAVADLRESFHLRRDPARYGLPVELLHAAPTNRMKDFSARGAPTQGTRQTAHQPPRDGRRAEAGAPNP